MEVWTPTIAYGAGPPSDRGRETAASSAATGRWGAAARESRPTPGGDVNSEARGVSAQAAPFRQGRGCFAVSLLGKNLEPPLGEVRIETECGLDVSALHRLEAHAVHQAEISSTSGTSHPFRHKRLW